jgi:hypothetical protein
VSANLLTTGMCAMRIGRAQQHHVNRLCKANRIPYVKAGRLFLIDPTDLERVREALKSAGWLQATQIVPATAV